MLFQVNKWTGQFQWEKPRVPLVVTKVTWELYMNPIVLSQDEDWPSNVPRRGAPGGPPRRPVPKLHEFVQKS